LPDTGDKVFKASCFIKLPPRKQVKAFGKVVKPILICSLSVGRIVIVDPLCLQRQGVWEFSGPIHILIGMYFSGNSVFFIFGDKQHFFFSECGIKKPPMF
jgi:hypothetical protein